jgi:hypothetical protein
MESARRSLAAGVFAPVVLAVLAPILCAAGSQEADATRVLMHNPADAGVVAMALNGAYRKLGRPACQQLLDDFRDAEGRTLRENLEPLGLAPDAYLSRLAYRDGRDLGSARCRKGGAAAVTHIGDRNVFVCAAPFAEQRPGIRENTLIHEMLHSLGLGENPPSSGEINGLVRRRCGS